MNKNIILVIIIVILAGAVGYFALVQSPEAPPVVTPPLDETSVKEVVIGFLEAKQSRDFENAKPFLSSDFAETIDPIEFAGTSNPHTGRFEIQDVELFSDEKTYKVDARVYQEYTGEGDIGYNDNSYYVKSFGDRYLIDNIEEGKYVDLLPTEQKEAADWKTYRNSEYAFELRYPNDWLVKENQNNIYFERTDMSQEEMAEKRISYPLSILIENTSAKSISDWFENEFSDRTRGSRPKKQPITIGGVNGIRYSDPMSIGGCHETFAMIENGKLFKFLRHGSTCDYSDELFTNIILLFKFAE
jgi:hypothetical protein